VADDMLTRRRARLPHVRWNAFPYVALLPAATLVLGLLLVPIIATIYHAFTNWDGLTSTFIGVKNFELIFRDPLVYQVFLNSLIFLASVPLIVAASLFAANFPVSLLHPKRPVSRDRRLALRHVLPPR
jgi:ABC-type sugar transport system permease subunit